MWILKEVADLVSPDTAVTRNDLIQELKELNVTRGILVQVARAGQLYEIRCEMPTCYCPSGRGTFDKKTNPMTDWALNADHYPTLRMDGGKLSPGNVRLAHVLCNREDFFVAKADSRDARKEDVPRGDC